MLKAKIDKIKSHLEACIFVGYPKGTQGGFFYSPNDNKVFFSTNTTNCLKKGLYKELQAQKWSNYWRNNWLNVELPIVDEILSYKRKKCSFSIY